MPAGNELLPKKNLLASQLASRHDSGSVPIALLEKAPARLHAIGVTLLVAIVIMWIGVRLVRGNLMQEFDSVARWGGPVFAMLLSVLAIVVSRTGTLPTTAIIGFGLGYHVSVSYLLALATYWGSFEGFPVEWFDSERIGVSWVAVWMLGYFVLVPARPRHTLVAATLSSLAPGSVFAVNESLGLAPRLTGTDFFLILVLPYLLCAGVCYVNARIIHGLGSDIGRAREMGSYRLRQLIGKGGMGEVWRSDHFLLARPAAVKLIQHDNLVRDEESSSMALARFEREAQITASLQSPHTVDLYDFGLSDAGTLYYVMELLDGVDLQTLVDCYGPLPPERVVYILRQVALSLREAHELGLIHRDIKPANVFLCRCALEYDFVKVLDFGLARPQRTGQALGALDVSGSADQVVGTPAYMAPEMILGNEPDGRADLYALGCVGYFLLTGKTVFQETTNLAMLAAQVDVQAPLASVGATYTVPPELDRLIADLLQKAPGARPQSATVAIERLDAIPFERPWSPLIAADWWAQHQPAKVADGTR